MALDGYRELKHTADARLQVWAADLDHLFIRAAEGMAAVSGACTTTGPGIRHTLALQAADLESLLVNFLTEILYLGESESLGVAALQVTVEGFTLRAEITAAPLSRQEKQIKAVTYHNLAVQESPAGWKTEIVFDV